MAMAGGTRRPVTDINVTPLIDVVLVLLIIFMVLTPLAEKQLFTRVPELEPPDQVVPPESVPPDQTVLTLRADGKVILGRRELTLEQAAALLAPLYRDRPSKVLFFNAEDGAKYGAAVKVLDAAHGAGVSTIGMMTDPPALRVAGAPAAPEPAR